MKKIITALTLRAFFSGLFLACMLSVSYAQPPSNDEPCDAIPISVIDTICDFGIAYFSNDSATDTNLPNPGCAFYQGDDVWFTVVVPASGNLTLEGGGALATMSDGAMAVYQGDCNNLVGPLDCDDDGGTGLWPYLSFSCLSPGQTLHIRFWGYGNNHGTFQLCAFDGGCTGPISANLVGDFSPCLNDTITYFSNAGFGTTGYTWNVFNGQIIAGGATLDSFVTVLWGSLGTGGVQVQVTCCGILSFPNYHSVTICSRSTQPTVTALASTVCSVCFDQLSITSGTLGSCAQWAWFKDSCDGPLVGYGTNILVYPTASTTYYARALNTTGGCGTGCDSVSVTVYIVGVSDLDNNEKFEIYPNPASDVISIRGEGINSPSLELVLTNTLGQVLKTEPVKVSNNALETSLNVSELPSGFYFLFVKSNAIKQVFRIEKI